MEIKHRTQLPELMRYYNLPMIAAELGVAEGYFSNELLWHGIQKLYCVDNYASIPHQKGDGGFPQEWHDKNFADAKNRLAGFVGKVIFLRGLSKDMAHYVADNSLGLVYLDADHSYKGVMSDLKTWFPKLVNGGIMAGHDYLMIPQYQVFDAVRDFTINKFTVHTIHENKPEDAGFWFQKS